MFFFIKKKYVWVGFLLGLTISLKVYTIFFLLYFLFKREFKSVLWTLFFIVTINSISFLVFGFDQALAYYHQWATDIAPRSLMANHKNQSFFGLFLRLFTADDPSHNMYINVLSLKPELVKRITYGVIILAALFPAWLLRKKITDRGSMKSILEYSLVFTALPVLSPLAWKSYFIFLWLPYLLIYVFLFRIDNSMGKSYLLRLKIMFWISIILNVFSTEAIVGPYFSDVLEAYSVITIGTILLLVIQLILIIKIKQFDLGSIKYQTLPAKTTPTS